MGYIFAHMKQAIQPGRVKVPRRPHGKIGMQGIIGCLGEVVTAIQQLRDRPVFYDAGARGGGVTEKRPWKATENGDEFINVASGMFLAFFPRDDVDGSYPNGFPMVGGFWSFNGGSVEITEDEGFIYAKTAITSTRENFAGPIPETGGDELYSDLYRPTGAITLYFSEDAPSANKPADADEIHMPIAKVKLEDGVAKVDFQILDHNPLMQIDMNFVFWGSGS
jgi:hypothetical protein